MYTTFMPKKILSEREVELLQLLYSEITGREVAKAYRAKYGRAISYGTLYTTLRRMAENGLVEITREDVDQDGRFRYYRILGAGTASLAATHERLRERLSLFPVKGRTTG